MISTHLERYGKRLQLWYRGKFDPKRKVHTLKGKCTLIGHISQIQTTNFTGKSLQKSDIGYNVYQYTTKDYTSQTWATKFTNGLQKTTKVGHRLQSLLIDYKDYKKVGHRLQSLLLPLLTVIDIYLSVLLLAKGHPKTTCPIHPIEGRYLMGKWLEYVQKYCRDHVLFLV